ncbi:MAG: hypothetical protein LBB39_01570 [Mycoplasmataceae bacterium]|jgi:hypothetical protein|nr:hypothetical protein [Mycoplasmataceae bacterium]
MIKATPQQLYWIWKQEAGIRLNPADFQDFLYHQGFLNQDEDVDFDQLGDLFMQYGNEYAIFAGLDFNDDNGGNDWSN